VQAIGNQGKSMKRGLRARLALVVCSLLAPLTLAACTAPSNYFGIDISNPAPEFTLNEKQKTWLAERKKIRDTANFYDCFVKESAEEGETAKPDIATAKTCSSLATQLKVLNLLRPEFNHVRDYTAMPLSTLASKAQGGDKQAQLELGIRFEEGNGVARDMDNARKLYAKAAADSGGTIWIYSPPVGNGTSGRVIPVDTGPKRTGLAEAKRRLGKAE